MCFLAGGAFADQTLHLSALEDSVALADFGMPSLERPKNNKLVQTRSHTVWQTLSLGQNR